MIHHSAERNQSYDCLEITRNDRYLISIQITFRYWPDRPSKAVETYFTLTRFRNNEKLLVAKSSFMVPAPSQRRRKLEKQPRSLVRSDLLQKGDRLCVTVSRPDLVYASTIDNFFGIVSLWEMPARNIKFPVVIIKAEGSRSMICLTRNDHRVNSPAGKDPQRNLPRSCHCSRYDWVSTIYFSYFFIEIYSLGTH